MFEMLQQDQRRRWQQGERVRVDSYLSQYPGLASQAGPLANLLCGEIVLREAFGDSPDEQEYLTRFPQCSDAVRNQFALLRSGKFPTSDSTATGPGGLHKNVDPEAGTTSGDEFATQIPGGPIPGGTPGRDPAGEPDTTPWLGNAKGQVSNPDKGSSPTASSPTLGKEFDTTQAWEPPTTRLPVTGSAARHGSAASHGSDETIQAEPQGQLLSPEKLARIGLPNIPGFELLSELGRGGMGIVYRARQISANRIVALKVMRHEMLDTMPLETRTSSLERFRTEAQAAARLQHDNLVSVYEVGELPPATPGASPMRYYAMRFVEGQSLFDLVVNGPLDNRRAAAYMEPVARALQSAHDQGILHRDLKPQNIMIEKSTDRPLVTDFGLAKFTEGEESLTFAGEVMGTPSYMSPEQAQDAASVTASADLYSLGATLYRLLTGRAPFQAANVAETIRQILDQEPVPPRQLNPAIDRDLETICVKCLQKEPSRRYHSCAALAEDLHRYLHGIPIVARPVGAPERLWRWCRRNPLPAILTGTAMVLAIATLLSIIIGYRNTAAALAVSESRLQRALQVVDELFTRVSEDELLNEPGMQPLRKDLLEKALKHYQYFLEESGGKAAIRDEVAAAHFRVGLISQVMGNSETAEKELNQARQMQQQLLQNKPDDPQRLKPLADSFNALGSFYNSQRQYKTSTQMFEETIALRAKLAKADPENLEFQRLRANAVMNLGLAKLQAGDASGANDDMLSAQTSRQELLDQDPTAAKVRRDLAMGWYSLGKSQATREQASPEELEAAIVYLRKAIQEFDLLLASDPRSMSNRYYLGVSHRLLGGKLAERGELTAAAEAYEAATKPIQSLALGNPEVTAYRAELAVLAMNRGTVYSATEKFVPAREAWEQAKKLTAELMEHDPEDPQLRTDLANSLGALGDLHRREGQKDQAIACFEQAQEQLRILREKDPQNNWLKSLWDENQELIRELKSDTPESQPKPTPSVDRE